VRTAAAYAPRDLIHERAATLRFDHPYAAVAVAGGGLPVFTAWVAEPIEVPADH
jgi:hypothetical protein